MTMNRDQSGFRFKRLYQNTIYLFQCQKPVICAIHSACIGGGTNMVAFGDIRYCTKDAWFQVKEAELGNVIKPLDRKN